MYYFMVFGSNITTSNITLVCAQTWNSALSYFLLGQQPIHHLLKLHPIKVFSKQWCCHWLYLRGTLHLQVMISGKSLFPPSLRFFLPPSLLSPSLSIVTLDFMFQDSFVRILNYHNEGISICLVSVSVFNQFQFEKVHGTCKWLAMGGIFKLEKLHLIIFFSWPISEPICDPPLLLFPFSELLVYFPSYSSSG